MLAEEWDSPNNEKANKAKKLLTSILFSQMFQPFFLTESILAVVKNNGLLPVVTMITSTHTIMQNEALVGIALAVNVINSMFFIISWRPLFHFPKLILHQNNPNLLRS